MVDISVEIGGGSRILVSNVTFFFWTVLRNLNICSLNSLISLKDPSDKRQIICDEKLKELLNVDTFCGFTVAKLLTAHLIKTEQ